MKISQPAYLDASNISHSFGATQALNSVNLTIAASGITALLGQNGAGKTTFIHACLGLLTPSKGSVSILGHSAGTKLAKAKLGVMLQDAALTDQLSAREQLSLFASYYPSPAGIEQTLNRCQLLKFADRHYKKLSGGQKRRVQFALAVIGKPKLLFLDEPTTVLDSVARKSLWQTIRALSNSGTAIVLTTHYLEEAEALADRVVVLDQGRLIADAPADKFKRRMSTSNIQCNSILSSAEIEQFNGVQSVQVHGKLLNISSCKSEQTLRELLRADPNLGDLSVSKPGLEEAFNQLTRETENA